MSQLSKFLDALDESEKNDWYKTQVALASLLIAGLVRRFGLPLSLQIPDPHEVVSETILRIQNGDNPRYVWDTMTPPTLNQFFARCMRTTISSLRSTERSQENRRIRLASSASSGPHEAIAELEIELSGDAVSARLKKILAGRRTHGKTLQYLQNIEDYAARQLNAQEIAQNLGVRLATVETLRKRAKTLIYEARDTKNE